LVPAKFLALPNLKGKMSHKILEEIDDLDTYIDGLFETFDILSDEVAELADNLSSAADLGDNVPSQREAKLSINARTVVCINKYNKLLVKADSVKSTIAGLPLLSRLKYISNATNGFLKKKRKRR
jgi:hypothetical protein